MKSIFFCFKISVFFSGYAIKWEDGNHWILYGNDFNEYFLYLSLGQKIYLPCECIYNVCIYLSIVGNWIRDGTVYRSAAPHWLHLLFSWEKILLSYGNCFNRRTSSGGGSSIVKSTVFFLLESLLCGENRESGLHSKIHPEDLTSKVRD